MCINEILMCINDINNININNENNINVCNEILM